MLAGWHSRGAQQAAAGGIEFVAGISRSSVTSIISFDISEYGIAAGDLIIIAIPRNTPSSHNSSITGVSVTQFIKTAANTSFSWIECLYGYLLGSETTITIESMAANNATSVVVFRNATFGAVSGVDFSSAIQTANPPPLSGFDVDNDVVVTKIMMAAYDSYSAIIAPTGYVTAASAFIREERYSGAGSCIGYRLADSSTEDPTTFQNTPAFVGGAGSFTLKIKPS